MAFALRTTQALRERLPTERFIIFFAGLLRDATRAILVFVVVVLLYTFF